MRRKHPRLFGVLRVAVIIILVGMMALTIFAESTGASLSPQGILTSVIVPVEGAVSQLIDSFSNYLYRIKLRSNIEYEYNQLKTQNEELVLKSLLYDELEEENKQLREQLGEYNAQKDLNPLWAEVSAADSNTYFSTFTINKGSKDGVETQMAVITADGLIGYTYEVSENSAKVISIIDDSASLAALIESSRDQGAVKGTLGSTGEALCRMYYLPADSVPRPGDKVITSGVGVSFPKGLLIGYIRESTRSIEDGKHYIVVEPAADFQHIESVIVLRYHAAVEEMPENYNSTEVIVAPVATARPQAVIADEELNASTPVPLPNAPGRATPVPTEAPEEVFFIPDEEAMGKDYDKYVQVTPTPSPTPEPEMIDEDLIGTEEDEFPDDL